MDIIERGCMEFDKASLWHIMVSQMHMDQSWLEDQISDECH